MDREYDSLDDLCDAAIDKLAECNHTVVGLNNYIEMSEKNNGKILKRYAEMEQDLYTKIGELKTQVETLRAKNQSLASTNKTLESENQSLETDYDELTENADNLTKRLDRVERFVQLLVNNKNKVSVEELADASYILSGKPYNLGGILVDEFDDIADTIQNAANGEDFVNNPLRA